MLTIPEIMTAVVAVVGLGLSIYNTVQARRDKRPKLRVHVSFGFLVFGAELGNQRVLIDVGNGWNQTITLAGICIPLPDNRSLVFPHLEGERQMPIALAPGISTRFWYNSDALEAETIKAGIGRHEKFRVMAYDALDNKYLSNSISFKPMK
jgi:hypothetical protein